MIKKERERERDREREGEREREIDEERKREIDEERKREIDKELVPMKKGVGWTMVLNKDVSLESRSLSADKDFIRL